LALWLRELFLGSSLERSPFTMGRGSNSIGET